MPAIDYTSRITTLLYGVIMNQEKSFVIFLFKILPKSFLSRIFGYITRLPLPQFVMTGIITWYTGRFGVMDEYTVPAGGFRTLDDFFTRKLKPGARTIDGNRNTAVSPVDARVDQFGRIMDGTLIQAKGITYSLSDLIPSEYGMRFHGGSFITLYLSPGDYHRIHSPVDGAIEGFFHIPGKLYTVQEFMVAGLPGLFSLNERLISYISTPSGVVAVCKIGAMNVGRISLAYSDIVTNRMIRKKREALFDSAGKISIRKGDELGTFHLGSTIVLLFENSKVKFSGLKAGEKVRVGDVIATLPVPAGKKS